ncbi:ATP-binding protein [Sphaerisporangium dianthi]|uniref:ATP-binding protein n=1 Tax=Sphaerisporangium dianthi TaxID=1436120 RepID=A0ABV9CRK8_9ACTN
MLMIESFQQSLPGGPAAVDAACAWMSAIVGSVEPGQAELAVRITRELMAGAIRHTPATEELHLCVIPLATNLVIEIRDPGAPAADGTARTSWADLSLEVAEFGSKQIAGQGHIAWVLLPPRRGSHD